MTKGHPRTHNEHPGLTPVGEHTDTCTGARFVWQTQILPSLPRLGYCTGCSAVTIDKTSRWQVPR